MNRCVRTDRATRLQLVVSLLVAAMGCSSDPIPAASMPAAASGSSGPSGPSGQATTPGSDPMQIGQHELPKSDAAPVMEMDGADFPKPDATSFETAKEVESGGATVATGSVPASRPGLAAPPASPALAPGAASAAGSPGQPPVAMAPQAASDSPMSTAMREIVEADIVQAQGDILYLLNRFRGLVLVDMSKPDSPFVRGRVPFQAEPVDMYLRDGKAYIVMSDYFSYWQFDSDSDPLGFHGSRVLVVDVRDPAKPAVSGGFNVDGEITDTRIVGGVLYAVSKRNPDYWRYDTQDWHDTSWVLSIDLSDPQNIRQVDKHEFPGAANLIQVYQTALSVAAIDPNYYLVDADNARQTKITYVDISDPMGAVKLGGSAYVPGSVSDKFKMDLSEGQLRVISADWYWHSDSAATLTVLDASNPDQLMQRAQIPIANDSPAGSSVQPGATRFADGNMFVNLCWWLPNTSQQDCRIDFYDLSKPSAPIKAGQLEVPDAITHFEVRGQRLLSLGRVNGGGDNQVHIGLFDTTDLHAVKQLSNAFLGDQGAGSAALSDYKAFKVLDDLNMILLPLSWMEPAPNGGYIQRQGAQIVDWLNDQLLVRGKVIQNGYVERAIAFHDRVLSISTQQLQVIDASDRDRPVVTANLFLVRNVLDVFSIGGYAVQLAASEDDGSYKFFVLPFGEDDMAKSLAELPVTDTLQYQLQAGNIVYVIGQSYAPPSQFIRAADFSDPLHPRWRGEYHLTDDIQHIYDGGYSSFYDFFWNPSAGQPLEKQLLPVTTRTVNADPTGRRYYKNKLQLIDLRDPDNLHLAQGAIDMPDFPFVNKVGHGKTLYSTHTEPALDANGNPKQYHERYFLDRVDASDPNVLKALPKVNIPGRLIDVDAAGALLYTVDYQWDEHGRRRNSFNVSHLEGDTARLVTVLPVGDELDRARYLDREIWFSTHSYPWFGRDDESPDSRQPYTRLTRLHFADSGAVMEQVQHDVAGYHFDLLDVEGPRIYLASSYPTGLLILDTTNFSQPEVLGAARTIGYVSRLIDEGDYLYLPMGSYGVRRVEAQP